MPASVVILLCAILLSIAIVLVTFRFRARDPLPASAGTRDLEFKQLWRASLQVAGAENYGAVLRSVVDQARELVQGDASALCMWDEQRRWWVVQGASGAADAFEVKTKPFGEKSVECPVVRFKYRESHVDVPIRRGDQIIGCLCVANQGPRDFSPHDQELLQAIATQAAIAIDHARRLESEGTRAAEEERERLAREMHDTLAQLLGFVTFKSQSAREFLAQGQAEQAHAQLEQLSSIAQQLYADTRELILGLRTEISPARGLVPALRVYAEWFGELSGVPTQIQADGLDDFRLAPAVEVQLLRVVQEALSNVRKHAHARHAWVRLEHAGEFAEIRIEDDGVGFDPANLPRRELPRFGLNSMRERVESVGGAFAIYSARGAGAAVVARIPMVYRGDTER